MMAKWKKGGKLKEALAKALRDRPEPLPTYSMAIKLTPEKAHEHAKLANLHPEQWGNFVRFKHKGTGKVLALYHPESQNFSYAPFPKRTTSGFGKSENFDDVEWPTELLEETLDQLPSIFKMDLFQAIADAAEVLPEEEREKYFDAAIEPLQKAFLDKTMDEVARDFEKIVKSYGIKFGFDRKIAGTERTCKYNIGDSTIIHKDIGNQTKIELRLSETASNMEKFLAKSIKNRLASMYYISPDDYMAKSGNIIWDQGEELNKVLGFRSKTGGADWSLGDEVKRHLKRYFSAKKKLAFKPVKQEQVIKTDIEKALGMTVVGLSKPPSTGIKAQPAKIATKPSFKAPTPSTPMSVSTKGSAGFGIKPVGSAPKPPQPKMNTKIAKALKKKIKKQKEANAYYTFGGSGQDVNVGV